MSEETKTSIAVFSAVVMAIACVVFTIVEAAELLGRCNLVSP